MASNKLINQSGIALFQVLLITTIISVLAIQFTQTARNQVSIAQTMADRVEALAKLKSSETQLLFTLLTQSLINSNQNQISEKWNFFGKPFFLAPDISIVIQDQNSVLSLYNNIDSRKIELLVNNVSSTKVNASIIANSIIDWQDNDSLKRINGGERNDYVAPLMPTNLPFQYYEELQYVKGVNASLIKDLKAFVTIRPQTYFNPLNAPKDILLLTLDGQKVENIISLRDNGELTSSEFSKITNITEEEGIFFSTSGLLKIQIHVKHNEVELSKSIELLIQPYDTNPYIEYGVAY